MGIPIPVLDYNRPIGSIKEYLILLYFELISTEYYKNGKSLLWSYWHSLFLWCNAGSIISGPKCIYVPFYNEDKIYKIPLILRTNDNIIKITDDKGNDLREWAGPYKNFYSIKLTPEDIGCKKVIVSYDNGEEKVFDECNDIDI